MPTAAFEPAPPASDRPQTLTLDRSATGIGDFHHSSSKSHWLSSSLELAQESATYGTRGTRNDFQWHAEWIELLDFLP